MGSGDERAEQVVEPVVEVEPGVAPMVEGVAEVVDGMAEHYGDPQLGAGPDEATLAHMADEIIFEAAMGHIERLAEIVMGEGEGEDEQCRNPVDSGLCSEGLMEYEDWVEKMKSKMGQDKEGIKIIEEAKHDVMSFFVKAQGELGLVEFEKKGGIGGRG
nr:hypothetical protein Iba_chr12cCG11670 [Ipomoea batatas]